MARTTQVVSISAPPDEVEAWKAASGGKLAPWVREKLNEAVGGHAAPSVENLQTLIAAEVAKALAPPQTSEPGPYVPSPLAPLAPGATSVPVSEDLIARNREVAKVASFCRSWGEKWDGPGPDPLSPDCLIRPDVIAQHAGKLAEVRSIIAGKKANEGAICL